MNKNEGVSLLAIIKLAANHTSFPESSMSENSRVGEDLWIIGDDAEEFISEYKNQFSIDLSGFEFGEYFPDESSVDMYHYINTRFSNKNKIQKITRLLDGWFWNLLRSKKLYKTITLGDLLKSAINGK